jgi:L-lysine 6-transaminase
LRTLRDIADRTETVLVFDEVQTGFGGTGQWWDWQHHQVQPDVMVFGKKTQVCGIAATQRFDEVDSVFHVRSRISSTFSGDLVDMVRCQRVIEIITEQNLLAHVRRMGTYLLDLLTALQKEHAAMSQARGRGLLAAFDMPTTEARDRLLKACYEQCLLLLPCGSRSIRFRPPLDVRPDSVGRAAALLETALRRL